jgi:hypothetical protein
LISLIEEAVADDATRKLILDAISERRKMLTDFERRALSAERKLQMLGLEDSIVELAITRGRPTREVAARLGVGDAAVSNTVRRVRARYSNLFPSFADATAPQRKQMREFEQRHKISEGHDPFYEEVGENSLLTRLDRELAGAGDQTDEAPTEPTSTDADPLAWLDALSFEDRITAIGELFGGLDSTPAETA